MRKIPKSNNPLLNIFRSGKGEMTISEYEGNMIKFEMSIEKKVIEILNNIGVHAAVKSNRYSLPYTAQMKITRHTTSYIIDAFNTSEFIKQILKKVLEEDLHKLRFYVMVEIEGGRPFGAVNYYFKYYPHQ